jgi:hypothetical protein
MGLFLSSLSAGVLFLLRQFLCSICKARFFARTHKSRRCHAQGLSRLAVAPTLPRAPIIARPHLDSSEHGSTLVVVGMTINEGSAPFDDSRPRGVLPKADQRMTHDGASVQACASPAAMRSASMMVGRFVLADGICGMIEASAMTRPSVPCTRPRESTTACRGSRPIAHVPAGW